MQKIKRFFLKLTLISFAILILVGCDQTTKKVARTELKNKPNVEIAGLVNLHYVENEDGMLGLGKDLSQAFKFVIFIIIVSIFLTLLLIHILIKQDKSLLQRFAFLLILCGGIGNLIDRLFNSGKVVDFIRLKLPIISNAVFNIADFYVTVGFIFLLLSVFAKKKSHLEIKF